MFYFFRTFLIWICFFSSQSIFAEELNTCENPGRVSEVCYKMKDLRSHIQLLDIQRELMQVNYEFLSILGKNIDQIATSLLTARNFQDHLKGMNQVKEIASELTLQALRYNPQALKVANSNRLQLETGM